MFVPQHTGGHQRGNGVSEQVLGFAIELLQQVGLLQLVDDAQLALHGNAGIGQVINVCTQQLNCSVKCRRMVVFEGG